MMKWKTKKRSWEANAEPSATAAPTTKPIAFDPNAVEGRSVLLRDMMLDIDTAAAIAHRNRLAPSQMPLGPRRAKACVHEPACEHHNGMMETSTTASRVALMIAVIRTDAVDRASDRARKTSRPNIAEVVRMESVPSTGARTRGIAIGQKIRTTSVEE